MEKIKLKNFLTGFERQMGIKIKSDNEIRDFFYGSNGRNNWLMNDDKPNPKSKLSESYETPQYKFETQYEQRGDGQGYETYFVFQRKSDKKYFYYYIYDGRIEADTLEECTKEVTTKWSFECKY